MRFQGKLPWNFVFLAGCLPLSLNTSKLLMAAGAFPHPQWHRQDKVPLILSTLQLVHSEVLL